MHLTRFLIPTSMEGHCAGYRIFIADRDRWYGQITTGNVARDNNVR